MKLEFKRILTAIGYVILTEQQKTAEPCGDEFTEAYKDGRLKVRNELTGNMDTVEPPLPAEPSVSSEIQACINKPAKSYVSEKHGDLTILREKTAEPVTLMRGDAKTALQVASRAAATSPEDAQAIFDKYMALKQPAAPTQIDAGELEAADIQKAIAALEIAIGYPALVADGVGKMPILKDRAKDDCRIIGEVINLLEAHLSKLSGGEKNGCD